MNALPTLTPEIILTLRASVRHRSSDGTNDRLGVPFMVAIPSEGTFSLHAYGTCVAVHADPRVLGALMLSERIEPGFIRWVLDSKDPPDLAGLNPLERARQRSALAAESARRRQAALDQADAEREARSRLRYTPQVAVADISLDDLDT